MFQLTCECGTCAKCRHRAYCREWRERTAERQRELSRARYDRLRPVYQRDPVKRRAGHLVYTEVRAGRLIPEPCEVCGAKADAHHDDYSQPLEVRWLCRRHHMREHL